MLLLLLAGCSFATRSDYAAMQDEVVTLKLDQQMFETRVSTAEERLNFLKTQVDDLRESMHSLQSRREQIPASPVPEVGARVPQTRPSGAPLPVPVARSSSAAAEAYKTALADLFAGRYKEAERGFRDFSERYPESSFLPNAGYWLGETYYSQDQYDSAILAFQSVAGKYPKHDKAAASLLKTGYSYEKLGDMPNARFYLQQLLTDYPESEPATLARAALDRLK